MNLWLQVGDSWFAILKTPVLSTGKTVKFVSKKVKTFQEQKLFPTYERFPKMRALKDILEKKPCY